MAFWKNFYLPLWIRGDMTVEQLQQAVTKGRITIDEMEEILATPQSIQ